ncbi:MAG: primosomal protein N' [Gammaproteobacteria bacterium]|nr:primosomal protein N' [Gammaproteobacteria bacterium]
MPPMSQTLARIAVFAPLRRLFDYLVPAQAQPGMRVRLPFGRSQRLGVIVQLLEQTDQPSAKLKPIEALLDETPLLSAEDLAFLGWTASYYQHPLGEVLAAALPALLRSGQAVPEPGISGWRLTAAGQALEPVQLQRAPRQQQVIALLQGCGPAGLPQAELFAQLGTCGGVLASLAEKQLIERHRLAPGEGQRPILPGPELNAEQQQAVTQILAGEGFHPCLLDGITGSGKTEVYLAASRALIDRGAQVLVLVPEIALTPQTTRRFAQRLGLEPLVLHSALNDRERALAWHQASRGEAALVLGTRSAIFTPLPRLGLIIVDEEHDLSFKQQEGFRYSARDLALVRASRAACAVVLGSATPSLESLHNSQQRRFQLLRLNQRPGAAQSPRLQLVDIRSAPLQAGLSAALLDALQRELAEGNQVLLFLNRRGYAPVLICHDCGWIAHCQHCDARLTLHRGDQRLSCHHCGHLRRIPTSCPECQGSRLLSHGVGTEQLEELLQARFGDYSSVRIDRDSTRRKGSLQHKLDGVREGRHQILIGTQMLAKGHDFPEVTLVAMVDVDQGLFGADFRATERMAQLITQVAGRAGRAERPGRVLIQTRQPDHPLLLQLPPFSHQALLRVDARDSREAETFAQQALELGQTQAAPAIEFWGPAPAAMERRAGRHRQQLLLQSASRPALQAFLGPWLSRLEQLKPPAGLRWSIDVDPQEML